MYKASDLSWQNIQDILVKNMKTTIHDLDFTVNI